MTRLKTVLLSAAALGSALAFAAPASAVVTTFATFSAQNSDANLRYVNAGNSVSRSADASIYTTASATGTTPASALVRFSFLQSAFVTDPAIQNITAIFTLRAMVARNTPTSTVMFGNSTFFDQPGISGSFSFLTKSAITLAGPNFVPHTYAAGSNLLSAAFTGMDISGKISGSSGADNASTLGGDTINFTSDFLDFTHVADLDLGMTLTSVAPTFLVATGANKALKSFRTNASGQFSSDPAPIINGLAVPEPASWALMIAGFGGVGVMLRRRPVLTSIA